MCKKQTLRKIGSIFVILFHFFILLNIAIWYLLPRMAILPFQRLHLKNKVKRKLRRYGMPREAAKVFANEYKAKLTKYGSVKGLRQMLGSVRKDEVEEDKLDARTKAPKIVPLYLINSNHPSLV